MAKKNWCACGKYLITTRHHCDSKHLPPIESPPTLGGVRMPTLDDAFEAWASGRDRRPMSAWDVLKSAFLAGAAAEREAQRIRQRGEDPTADLHEALNEAGVSVRTVKKDE